MTAPDGARDDADHARLARERALALGREQPLGGELRLEALDGLEQGPAAGGLQAIGDELQPAARGPERRLAAQAEPRAVDAERAHSRRHVRAVHHDVDRRLFALVLQAEIEVTARRGASAGDFALDPDGRREGVFDGALDRAIELRHAERAGLVVRRVGPSAPSG